MMTKGTSNKNKSSSSKKMTIPVFQQKKVLGEPISMLTGYDYPTALILDEAGIDAILVGDSLGMVVLGYENTLPLKMEDMLHHCKAVSRGSDRALLIGDMPFLSYQVSVVEAIRNAGRFLQEGGMDAVKLEGGRERIDDVKAIIDAGIPVMGHLGLTPQSIHILGGFHAQGKSAEKAKRLLDDALMLEEAGCFAIVLESIPARLGELISQRLKIPTIGIGAGPKCDGQVLVTNDILGMYDRLSPKFVKKYLNLHQDMLNAFSEYITDVKTSSFPTAVHSVEMPDNEWEALLELIK